MKKTLSYILSLALAATAFNACDNDFERPPMVVPVSSWQANTTIAQFKADYWNTIDAPVTVGLNADGDSIKVKARVVSSDASGNIFKYLFVEDATGALPFSLDFYDICNSYKYGQEVYVNLTGLTVGGYGGLFCVGNGTDDKNRVARCAQDIFTPHAQVNGLPNAALIDTVTADMATVIAAKADAAGLREWQGRLVRFDGVTFQTPGEPFAGSENAKRYFTDAAGNSIMCYNSSYADFKDTLLPAGEGSVVGILSYFSPDWQVLLLDADGFIGFDGLMAPKFTPAAGTVPEGQKVTILCGTAGATVHYTLDGTDPTAESTLYTEPIEITGTVTIKAVAVAENGTLSDIVSATYTIALPELFSETFTGGSLGAFAGTSDNSAWDGWRANTKEPLCAIANSYVSGVNQAATAWLYSPAIDLTAVTDATLTFEQAYGFYFPTAPNEACTVNIRESAAAGQPENPWQPLTITVYPDAPASSNWSGFVSNTLDISAYAGKNIEIAFKYVNDGSGSIAWEIRNLTVNGR